MRLVSNLRLHPELCTGVASSLELAIRFTTWADSMGIRLTAEAIRKHYGCSRATSYRWLSAYRAARAHSTQEAA